MEINYSVIIPHFNDEVGLQRLLDSIPSRNDIQVIVVDDRSDSDKYVMVSKNSGLPNVETYLNNRTKSAGTCRNIGLEHAKGKFIVFSDSDDVFTAQAFDYIDTAIETESNADIYFFNVTSVSENGSLSVRHIKNSELVLKYLDKQGSYYEERLRLTHNVPWGKVIRRELVEEHDIKFDQTIIANDGVFSLKVGKAAKKIFVSSETIYCVTTRGDSLTRQKDVAKYRVRLEVYVRYFGLLTDEEKRKINASPIPLLYLSLDYGLLEFFRSFCFLAKNKVNIFKYFKFKKRFLYIIRR